MQPEALSFWITGASSGFGHELALRCAKRGAKLALSSRSLPALKTVAAACRAEGSPEVVVRALDVRDAAAVEEAATFVHSSFGRIDGFVASAADVPLGDLETLTDEQWSYGIENKLLGTIYCLRSVLPIMRAQNGGRAVILSGIRGTEPLPNSLLPGAVNAALNNVVKALSRQYARFNIAINTVSPSLVMTARGQLYIRSEAETRGKPESEIQREWTEGLPAQRFVAVDEIVTVLYELLTAFPAAFSGQTVVVDGAESRGTR